MWSMIMRSPRMALGNLAELGHGSGRERHHRHIVTFRGLPEPIGCAVFQPLSRFARVKRHPDSKHIGLSFPRRHERAAFRLLQREPAHDAKAIRIQARRFERSVITVGFPGRWHEHAAQDPGSVHLAQQLIVPERHGTMRRRSIFSGVWFFRCLRRPNVDLRIDNRS